MNHFLFLTVFAKFLLLWLIFSFFGYRILILLKYRKFSLDTVSISFMISTGIFTYIFLIIGIFFKVSSSFVYELLFIFFVFSLPSLKKFLHDVRKVIARFLKDIQGDFPTILFIVVSLLILVTLYLSALQPPHASDELHYHMPQVKEIIATGKINLSFGGHYFYGNIPKFMEIVFAWAAILGDYQMSHLVNLSIFISFLIIVFKIISKNFSVRTASFAILLLLLFDNLTWNSTVGFIDTATLSFELSSLFIISDSLINKRLNKHTLILSGLVMGLAFATKYSPSPTFIFVLITLLVWNMTLKKKAFALLTYGISTAVFSGFWYLKNLINFQNPFYPLYFGHKGIGEDQYLSLISAIQEFGEKNIRHFLEIISVYKNINNIHVYLSIFIFPLALLFRKNRSFKTFLFVYSILYIFYWFFIATHQIRFLIPALVVTIILSSTLIEKLNSKILSAIIIAFMLIMYKNHSIWESFWNTKLNLVERQYGLGKIEKTEYLTREFGCQYLVIKHLEDNSLKGSVIDNWSVWHAPSVSFYATGNKFLGYAPKSNESIEEINEELTDSDFKYLYYNQNVKERYLNNMADYVMKNKKDKLRAEEYILKHSKLIYHQNGCSLFEINLVN